MNLEERLRLIDREIRNQLIAELPEEWSSVELRVDRRLDGGRTTWVHEVASPEGRDTSGVRVDERLRAAARRLIELMESLGHRVKRVRASAWLDEERDWTYQATLDYDI